MEFALKTVESELANSEFRLTIAHVYETLGELDLARHHVDKAAALNSGDARVLLLAQQIYTMLGDDVKPGRAGSIVSDPVDHAPVICSKR